MGSCLGGLQGGKCRGSLRGSELGGCAQTRWSHGVPAVRSGFLHLAEALAFRGDVEVIGSTVRALVATLRAGEKCGVEPELIGKGTWACGSRRTRGGSLAAPLAGWPGWHPGPCRPGIGTVSLGRQSEGHRSIPAGATQRSPLPPTVLRGLVEVRSPHLEELLTALFSAASALPASRAVAVVSSLLLQEEGEPAVGQQDADGSR